jgi:hypothetical protein
MQDGKTGDFWICECKVKKIMAIENNDGTATNSKEREGPLKRDVEGARCLENKKKIIRERGK